MDTLKDKARGILEVSILPFWINKMTDYERGGYYGRMSGYDELVPDADKGAVLNARILWAMSAAYRVLREKEYLIAAERAKRYLIDQFVDHEFGGVYWCLDCEGNPKDDKKQTYATGFAIYGLSEFARATGDKEALEMAIRLFHDIEEHAFDTVNDGYVEALTRDWKPIGDMRLSDKDENGSKTMNTHLHIIEPYTNLFRVWKDPLLERQMCNLLDIFTDKLLNKDTHHLDLFFDDEWHGKHNIESFGHDIEASWLLHEAALVLGDKVVLGKIEPIIRQIAEAADEGLSPDGAMIYERWADTGITDTHREWWVQCENALGHLNLYRHFGDKQALNTALLCLDFITNNLIDYENGEWHWGVNADGTVDLSDDKAGMWKCPYHNSRMCLEIIESETAACFATIQN